MNRFGWLLMVLATWASVASATEKKRLVFGIYTSEKATSLFPKMRPVLDMLEEKLAAAGHPVTIQLTITREYEAAIKKLTAGEFDFSRFGPASYVLAKKRNKHIRLLAVELNKGKKKFKGHFIARSSSKIKSIKDIKGKPVRFAFGNRRSTIGRYLAQSNLLDRGISQKNLESYDYLGRHDRVALAVLAGEYDVGVVKAKTYKKYMKRGIRSIGHFENVTKPWIASGTLDSQIVKLLRDSLLSVPANHPALLPLKTTGFVRVKDGEYDGIRKAMKQSKEF